MPLHPQAQAFLDALAEQNPPAWSEMSTDEARDAFAGLTDLFGTGPAMHGVEDRTIAGQVSVRIYRPVAESPLPCVIYLHGGGWVLGDVNTHDTLCRRLAGGAGCAVISVDYRRAPEHKFPQPLDDGYNVAQYVMDHAATLGILPSRIAVAGDSAGGNLAAGLCLRARDEQGPRIHSQWLLYPVLDRSFDTESYRSFAEGYGLTREAMRWFWEQYLTEDSDAANPRAAPAQGRSLKDLPPAHIITAEFDVLRDEGESYADRLQEAGVTVTRRRYEGMIHGFMHFSEPFDDGRRAVREVAHRMKEALHA